MAADTVGLASFTVTGTLTGLQGNIHTYVPGAVGLITAVGGGVMRDLMAQRMPSVLTADVYATASLAYSLVMCLCWHFESQDLAPFGSLHGDRPAIFRHPVPLAAGASHGKEKNSH